mmetsp:Transcript_35998/g.103510  ORF Transcript_35998/g.103510 Transcript_35998/m.103510 type:complete len:206 (+) Transcript_35998:659-1276(+)
MLSPNMASIILYIGWLISPASAKHIIGLMTPHGRMGVPTGGNNAAGKSGRIPRSQTSWNVYVLPLTSTLRSPSFLKSPKISSKAAPVAKSTMSSLLGTNIVLEYGLFQSSSRSSLSSIILMVSSVSPPFTLHWRANDMGLVIGLDPPNCSRVQRPAMITINATVREQSAHFLGWRPINLPTTRNILEILESSTPSCPLTGGAIIR